MLQAAETATPSLADLSKPVKMSIPQKTILMADPTIFYEDGTYYIYGTDGVPDGNCTMGFVAYKSTDIEHWEGPIGPDKGYVLTKEGGKVFGTTWFWAPQVFRYKGSYRMAYAANEYIAIAESDSPAGPFIQKKVEKLPTDVKQIDPYVFFDDDGKIYLYHVRLEGGNKIFVAELNEDLSAIKRDTLKLCIAPTKDTWENVTNADWGVAEGPTVLKKDGKYYLFYSANGYTDKAYAVGYAVADSPYGPWKRYKNNPVLCEKMFDLPGTGHGDFYTTKEGELHYIFHIHNDHNKIGPRRSVDVRFVTEKVDGETVFKALPGTLKFMIKK